MISLSHKQQYIRLFPLNKNIEIWNVFVLSGDREEKVFKWFENDALSPIRTVIVSQGDVNDFHHLQGVVGDFNAVRIQDVCVFLSPPP